MSGGRRGYDFIYEPDVRVIADSLTGSLREQLDEAEHELLTDQSQANPRVRLRHGITTVGVISTTNLEVYFQRINPLVARVIDIQIRA